MQSLLPSTTVTRKEINEHYKVQTGASICIIPLSESTLSLIILKTAFPTKNTVSVAHCLGSISFKSASRVDPVRVLSLPLYKFWFSASLIL